MREKGKRETEQTCRKCGDSAGPFVPSSTICKRCRAAEKAAWYQRRKAGEDTSWQARKAQYTPEQKEGAQQRRKQQCRYWQQTHRERVRERSRHWQQTHPELVRERNRRSYARCQADPVRRAARNAYHRIYQKQRRLKKKEEQEEKKRTQ